MLLSEQMKAGVERFCHRVLVSSPLLARANQGGVTPRVVHAYLCSLHYALSHTVPHLRRARRGALERGETELVDYFDAKLHEEEGHEAWAESDMRKLFDSFGGTGPAEPVPSVLALMRYNERLIDEEPRLYVAYMVCAEYFTVLIGPAWITALTRGCGIPLGALTAVSNHVEADSVHAIAGFQAVLRWFDRPELEARLPDVLQSILDLLAQLPEDLLALCPESGARGETQSSAQWSAEPSREKAVSAWH